MTNKKFWTYIKDYLSKFFVVCFFLLAICGIIHQCTKHRTTSSPVEENRIDSLKTANTNIIVIIDSLENIKDEKIIEVKTLNNDSTLVLFYELLRKR